MKKMLCVLLTLVLSLSLVVAVSAKEVPEIWELSEDGEILHGPEGEYQWYPMAPGEILRPKVRYDYEQDVFDPVTEEYYTVVVSPDNPHMVFLCEYTYDRSPARVYVTQEGKRILDEYREENFSRYLLYDGGGLACPISEDLVAALDSQTADSLTVEVTRLADLDVYWVMGYDETDTLAHIHGGVFLLNDGAYYYVNCDSLDNTHFDANGNLSYRSGQITLVMLGDADSTAVTNARGSLRTWASEFRHQESEVEVKGDPMGARAVFLVMTVLAGFAIPAVPLVLSLVFTRSKRAVNPKRWYLLAVLSVLWMIVIAAITILIVR